MRKGASIKASPEIYTQIESYCTMAAMSLKVAVIQWDILLDRLEETISRQKCIGCRAVQYHRDSDVMVRQDALDVIAHEHEFDQVHKAYLNLLSLSREVKQMPRAIRHCCHQQSHGCNKAFVRELAYAETKLMVALHYHPLIKDVHLCYLCYEDAFHYNVDSVVCDDLFLMVQTMKYVELLRKMQRLFD